MYCSISIFWRYNMILVNFGDSKHIPLSIPILGSTNINFGSVSTTCSCFEEWRGELAWANDAWQRYGDGVPGPRLESLVCGSRW